MVSEHWGTFSIYDHRDSIFVKSLVLFDRVVIPIPEYQIGDLTNQEIDRLYADATYLEQNGAAIIYPLKQGEFQEYQNDIIKEGLTVKKRDLLYDTRLMLKTRAEDFKPKGVYEISTVPVYGVREQFLDAYNKISPITSDSLLLELSQVLTAPNENTPLESIIKLREKDSFQSARKALREWQVKKIPDLLTENSEKQILIAKEEFKEMLRRYEEEINKSTFNKSKLVVTSVLAIGAAFSAAMGQIPTAIAFMSGIASNLFSLKESFAPTWKDLRGKNFEAAAVIYEANRIL